MRDHLKVRLYPRIFICLLVLCVTVLIVVGVQKIAAIGRGSPGSSANLQSAETPKAKGTPPLVAEPRLPLCPLAGLPILQPSRQKTGHHKVTLSWNASAPAVNSESKAVGYCLYRSKKKDAAKQKPTCDDCEQINSIAIAATGCVDDLVEDGATYHYVVTAINAQGKASISSNETPAQIPPGKEIANPVVGCSKQPTTANPISVGSYPLCRGTTGSK